MLCRYSYTSANDYGGEVRGYYEVDTADLRKFIQSDFFRKKVLSLVVEYRDGSCYYWQRKKSEFNEVSCPFLLIKE